MKCAKCKEVFEKWDDILIIHSDDPVYIHEDCFFDVLVVKGIASFVGYSELIEWENESH